MIIDDPLIFAMKSTKNSAAKLPKLDRKLMSAIKRGNFTLTKSLLDNCKVNINCADQDEMTPLHHAIKRNNFKIICLLLARNVDVNPKMSKDKCTPLIFAIGNKRRNAAHLLLRAGADVDAHSMLIRPLDAAIAVSDASLTEALLFDYMASFWSDYILWDAYDNKSSASVVKILLESSDVTYPNGQFLLCEALKRHHGHEVVAELLMDEPEIDPLRLDTNGETTLHCTAAGLNDNAKLVRLLLERGVEVDAVAEKRDRMTALHYAVQRGKSNMTRELIDNGADVNAKTASQGISPLYFATELCSAETIELLISRGADLRATTRSGQTALHNACFHCSEDNIRALLINGADPLVKDESGRTALQLLPNLDSGAAWQMVRRLAATSLAEKRHVDDRDLELIAQRPQLLEFYNQCALEIERMRRTKIYHDLTLLRVQFVVSEDKLAKLLRNEDILASLKSKLFKQSFPLYEDFIFAKFKRAEEKMKTHRATKEGLQDIFKSHFPELVIDRLTQLLIA